MGHPNLDNRTPFAFEPAFLTDEGGHSLFVPIVKATYAIKDNNHLELAEEQVAVNLAGEYWGDPDTSSYKYEPEGVFVKPVTDCVLIGHAYAPRPGTTEIDVGCRIGPVHKIARVFGDRFWVKSFGSVRMTKPKELERIPLRYENAFGGWDHAHSAPDQSQFEPRNPVGTGFRSRWNAGEDSVRLPNVEDPSRLIRRLQDRPPPAGFGFTTACWQPRAALAGTFDDFWMRERMPLLPFDFDRRYFNGASQGLTAPHYLKGDEVVTVVNVSPNGKTEFRLPGTAAPRVRVELRGHHEEVLQTNLDTVVVNLEENLLLLIWRAHLVSRGTPQDVVSVVVDSDDFPAPVTIG